MAGITYTDLVRATNKLAAGLARNSEQVGARAARLEEEAQDTSRVAEVISAIRVDPSTVGECRDLVAALLGWTGAMNAYAAASATTARSAEAAQEQARRTHEAFQEAFRRSPVDRDELSQVKRSWLTQE
ncbi:hypothetical protein [Streptomyces sp. NPDC047315]|uniref:hypothetical protein n=1 Tax=Streptomyces sp. NPDC047315 TaxID=3155142 RepID=UPI0033ED8917